MYALPPLTSGIIIQRYKRFLVDVLLADGRAVTAHCPNTGSMRTCWRPGAPVQLSHSDNPKRKLSWTLERVDMGKGWIGVNTSRVNHIVAAAISGGHVPPLSGYKEMRKEPAFRASGFPDSRFDFLLTGGEQRDAFVEVKNTTLVQGESITFPDAVTERGRKHLELLVEAVRRGRRGIILFALNRPEGRWFEPAHDIDPGYADALQRVHERGVEIIAVRLKHEESRITVGGCVHIAA